MIVDQNEPAAGSVAEHLRIPFVNLLNLPLNFDPDVPPPFTPWPYGSRVFHRMRNRVAYSIFNRILSPITRTINRYRSAWALRSLRGPEDSFSRLGQICQMAAEFDFPRKRLPACFSYTGAFFEESLPAGDFPYGLLDGRPIVYAFHGHAAESRREHLSPDCGGLFAP